MQRIRHITVPSLAAVIVTLFILRIGHMSAGLQGMRYSFATAVGLSKNLVGFALLLVTNQIVRRLGGQTLA